jgi:hypothetical protein
VPYLFGVLNPDKTKEADRHNNQWLGPATLGIEITSDEFKPRCGLGNIDPQHPVGGVGGCSSAIEDALTFLLPLSGTRIVTQRQDKDSFGAMAVLMLRKQGKENRIDKMLVSWVGAMDRLGFASARDKYPELSDHFDGVETNAMNKIANDIELWPEIATKVEMIASILCHEMPREEMGHIASLARRSNNDFPFTMYGEVAFIEAPGQYSSARTWASRRFKVAIIVDPEFRTGQTGRQRRWTIVRQDGVFDRSGCEHAIHAAEAKARGITVKQLQEEGLSCGGPANIISCPQGLGREGQLSDDKLIAIVRAHLESGVVT